jgi:hypothetical protein
MHYLLPTSVAMGQTFVRAVATVNKPVNVEPTEGRKGRKEPIENPNRLCINE